MNFNGGSSLQLVVGHKRTDFPIWRDWLFVTARPESPTDFLLSEPGDPRLSDSLIGEYHYLFRLNRQLKRSAIPTTIRIAQYRRLVINTAIGATADNQPWTRIVTGEVARDLDATKLTNPRKMGFLISSLFPIPSVLAQYNSSHNLRDLLRFLADAVDAHAITEQDAAATLLVNALIPAPSNGTFPGLSFSRMMDLLERAAIQFIEGGFIERAGYQRRALGFCLERLNSYLLLKELGQHSLQIDEVLGQQITISEQSTVSVTN